MKKTELQNRIRAISKQISYARNAVDSANRFAFLREAEALIGELTSELNPVVIDPTQYQLDGE